MKHILVVDDDPDIVEAFKIILEMKDYQVTTIQNGEKVVEKAKELRPDLILLDILLSGTNGFEICKILKSLPETKSIPIVMISAHTNGAKFYKHCPADDFLEKPFSLSHLRKVIQYQLHNKRL